MKSKILFNPFFRIAGLKSLLIGLTGLILTSYVAYITGTHFNGLLDIGFAKDSDFWVYLVENSSQWIILSILLYVTGSLLSKSKIRAIDIFGTTIFSKIPFLITPVIRLIPIFQSFVSASATMYVIYGIYLISLIWTIVLLFNAYKVSCNCKNEKLIISFILCMISAEVLTNIFLLLII